MTPELTHLDRRVLDAVPYGRNGPGKRGSQIAKRLRVDAIECRRVLRGLEHLGHVRQTGGWWWRP